MQTVENYRTNVLWESDEAPLKNRPAAVAYLFIRGSFHVWLLMLSQRESNNVFIFCLMVRADFFIKGRWPNAPPPKYATDHRLTRGDLQCACYRKYIRPTGPERRIATHYVDRVRPIKETQLQ